MSAISTAFNRVDIIMQIFKCLDPRIAYCFGMTTKFFYSIYCHDILWRHYVEILFSKFVPQQDIAALSSLYMACLRIPNMMIFYSIFENLSFDLIGSFRAKSKLPKGKFMRIIPVRDDDSAEYTLALEEYNDNGSLLKSFHIFYDEVTNKLIAVNMNSNQHGINSISPTSHQFTTLTIHSDRIELSFLPSDVFYTNLYRLPSTTSFAKLNSCFDNVASNCSNRNGHSSNCSSGSSSSNSSNLSNNTPTSATARRNQNVVASLTQCQGLFTTLYGGHGTELIHVSIVMTDPKQQQQPPKFASTSSGIVVSNIVDATEEIAVTNTAVDDIVTSVAATGDGLGIIYGNGTDDNTNITGSNILAMNTVAEIVTIPTVNHSDTYDAPLVSYPRLQGLKVTGDPNICAGRHTFLIDLSLPTTIDPLTAIMSDMRPVVSFDLNGSHSVINLSQDRLPRIAAWYKGYGQINRTPDHPEYEWVGCQFIVYNAHQNNSDSDSNHNGSSNSHTSNNTTFPTTATAATTVTPTPPIVSFSILWDDNHAFFRHMMDFIPLPPLQPANPLLLYVSTASSTASTQQTLRSNGSISTSSTLLSAAANTTMPIHDQAVSTQTFINNNHSNNNSTSDLMEYCRVYKERIQAKRCYNNN